jgi:leucyl/phenylalanyl-tRNA--protein transferase
MARARPTTIITPELLLRAYSVGLFPMAETADDDRLFWVDPDQRGIFPLDAIRVSTSLAKTVRSDRFEVVVDRDFDAVIAGCAGGGGDRPETWINSRIRDLFTELFRRGHVHTVEAYRDGELVGGLYGLHVGGAFFGESMFHRATDASKTCLVHLAARLIAGGFSLLDAQFITPHLATLGAIEVPKAEYHRRLARAVAQEAVFTPPGWEMGVDGRTALALVREQGAGGT